MLICKHQLFICIIIAAIISISLTNCPNLCSGHGYCGNFDKCYCFKGIDEEEEAWTGADCSLRTCPKGISWISQPVKANDVHDMLECSNMGYCDRKIGLCSCYTNHEGLACERVICPNDCSMAGVCLTENQLAEEAGREYSTPWDADKQVGCVCDIGRRGIDCSLFECPSGPDPAGGYGNESGRDCSGRGICDYSRGMCTCFSGYTGPMCQYYTAIS